MDIPVTTELKEICQEISDKNLLESEWAEIESDDMFQKNCFVGGFDADEKEFCFSYYSANGSEYWLQFDLVVVKNILSGVTSTLSGSPAK